MDYLIRAEGYAAARGEDLFFKWVYTNHREFFTVKDSVWKTLSYMYGNLIADQLDLQEESNAY